LLKRTLAGMIRSHEQTGERTFDPALRTRYYKLSKDKAWEETITAVRQMKGYQLLHEVKSVGEIVVQKRTVFGRIQDITITLYAINPLKTAIDIYSASRGSFGDLGSNYRNILHIYHVLDQRLSEHKI